ncbi:hypothetical protein SAY86_031333 [Trapa natans]|uniref:Uncharacterized protein n=1 Tax=Trapa natans TaxID=22666 RepID=A0AAN7LRK8_TRANT|nr:hypothetical protein SAY86_031333 [Trapa natans]
MLQPSLHQNKIMLNALCFAVRTGNTFLRSLLFSSCSSPWKTFHDVAQVPRLEQILEGNEYIFIEMYSKE